MILLRVFLPKGFIENQKVWPPLISPGSNLLPLIILLITSAYLIAALADIKQYIDLLDINLAHSKAFALKSAQVGA